MDSIQSWALAVCITMVGATIFSMLVPNSNMKKVVTFAINLFFISSLLSPIVIDPPNIDFSATESEIVENSALTQTMQQEVITITENELTKELEQLFTQNGYKFNQIAIDINSTDGSIEKATIDMPTSELINEADVKKLVQNTIGVIPMVSYT